MDNLGDVFNGAGYVHILSGVTRGNALLAALVLSAIVGCSDPKAGTLPTASPTTSSPTPTTSVTSPPSDNPLAAAAQAYYRTLERVAGNPAAHNEFATLVDARCTCQQVVDLLRRLDREQHQLLFSVALTEPRVIRGTETTGTVVIGVTQSAGREVDATGTQVRSTPASKGRYAVDLVRSDNRWLVRRITRTS